MEDPNRLRVYRAARDFSAAISEVVRHFPARYHKLASQLDDAAESIGANIAEGCGRKNSMHGNGELIRSLHISMAEANEAEHRLSGVRVRRLVSPKDFYRLSSDVVGIKRQLNKLIQRLQEDDRGRLDDAVG